MGEITQLDFPRALGETDSKFVIEVYFDGEFSDHKANSGILCLWKRQPAGLEKLYRCPFDGAFIESEQLGGPSADISCTKCFRTFKGIDLVGEVWFRVPVPKWASILAQLLRRFELEADILLTRTKLAAPTIIEAEMTARTGYKGIDMLDAARKAEQVIYPMSRIRKDAGSGAELEKVVEGFLKA